MMAGLGNLFKLAKPLGHHKRAARAGVNTCTTVDAIGVAHHGHIIRDGDRAAGAGINTGLASRAFLFINLNCHFETPLCERLAGQVQRGPQP